MGSCGALCVIIVYLAVHVEGQHLNDSARLLSDKLTNYNKMLRPRFNQSKQMDIYLGLDLVSIQEFQEKEERISYTALLYLVWHDETFTWDPTLYGGLQEIDIDANSVWIPHMLNMNAVGSIDRISDDWHKVTVNHEGLVSYWTGNVFSSSCFVDVTYYPWDRQRCDLLFMAANYDASRLTSAPYEDKVSTNYFYESRAWKLINTSAERLNESLVSFVIYLERRPRFVVVNIILPMVLLSFLGVFVFLMPVECGERISYCLTVLLAIAVFLTLVSDTLPRVSDPMSYFSFYLVSVLVISVLETVSTILNLRLYYGDEDDEPGAFWSCFTCMMRCKCRREKQRKHRTKYPSTSREQTSSHSNGWNSRQNGIILYPPKRPDALDHMMFNAFQNGDVTNKETNIKHKVTWKDVSSTVDRFLFVFFSLLLISDTVVFIVYLSRGNEVGT